MIGMLETAVVVAGLFLLFLIVENRFPLRRQTRKLVPRLMINLVLSALSYAAAALLIKPSVGELMDWTGEKSFGLVHLLEVSGGIEFLVGFLLMDLSFYYWHVATHKVPFLWRFHNVHHCDPDMDVSTGFRFHFCEVALSVFFRITQVCLIGLSPIAYAAYELTFQANTLFHHSNVRLPIKLERVLNLCLVTPRMHGIHHSQRRHEADSNYGVIFPWWDRLHHTLILGVEQSAIQIGVPGYRQPADNKFWSLIVQPFRKQRDYWRSGEELTSEAKPSSKQKLAP